MTRRLVRSYTSYESSKCRDALQRRLITCFLNLRNPLVSSVAKEQRHSMEWAQCCTGQKDTKQKPRWASTSRIATREWRNSSSHFFETDTTLTKKGYAA